MNKIVKIKIVEDVREDMKEDNEYVKKVINDEIPIDKEKAKYTIVMTPENFAQLFSPQKLRLMLRIKKNNTVNIYQLAKGLGRKYEAVHRDIKELESFKLIKIKKKDNKRIPYIDENITLTAFA